MLENNPVGVVILLCFSCYTIWKWLRFHFALAPLLLLLGTCLMALISVRSVILFFLSTTLVFAYLGRCEFQFHWPERKQRRCLRGLAVFMSFFLLFSWIFGLKETIPLDLTAGFQAIQ